MVVKCFKVKPGARPKAARRQIETFYTRKSFILKHELFQNETQFPKPQFHFDTYSTFKYPYLM